MPATTEVVMIAAVPQEMLVHLRLILGFTAITALLMVWSAYIDCKKDRDRDKKRKELLNGNRTRIGDKSSSNHTTNVGIGSSGEYHHGNGGDHLPPTCQEAGSTTRKVERWGSRICKPEERRCEHPRVADGGRAEDKGDGR